MKAGFARIDITPPLGSKLQGYYNVRYADGILDPLMATAIVFDDGKKKGAFVSLDLIGVKQMWMDPYRKAAAERLGTEPEAIFIACTHTHLGPKTGTGEDIEYLQWLEKKVCDAVMLADQDLAPVTKMLYTRGTVKEVSFVRRYRMKDGSVKTNPGWQNPEILGPAAPSDEGSALLVLRRENAPEIAFVHFQVHPDCIGGCTISADFPYFVRDTYEKLIENARCVYVNGAQGDSNNNDYRLTRAEGKGYRNARSVGRRIALSVLYNYEWLQELPIGELKFGQKNIAVSHRIATPEEIAVAKEVWAYYQATDATATKEMIQEKGLDMNVPKAGRIARLLDEPVEKELYLTALSIGEFALAGIPGEPFTALGRAIKEGSPFTLTFPCCLANGAEGYYPDATVYEEGGYELDVARFEKGTGEALVEAALEVLNSLKDKE